MPIQDITQGAPLAAADDRERERQLERLAQALRDRGLPESLVMRWLEHQTAGHYGRARRLLRKRLCGARRKRDGLPCIAAPVAGKRRCRFHGGLSTGSRTPEGRASQRRYAASQWDARRQDPAALDAFRQKVRAGKLRYHQQQREAQEHGQIRRA